MTTTHLQATVSKWIQRALPLLLGIAVLVWTYKGFDFSRVWTILKEQTDYTWMIISAVFGVFSHVLRGWRWNLSLAPLGEYPRKANSVYAIFVSYAANLVVPRIGEVSRCGVLSKYEGVSFSKSLGTVVTERLIDTFCIGLITLATLLGQSGVFSSFFQETGTDTFFFVHLFSSVNFYVTLICLLAVAVLGYLLMKRLTLHTKVKNIVSNVWKGCLSLKDMPQKSLFILYTIGIWACYFLQFYLTFFCFHFSSSLGVMAGLVLFVVGSIAVVVPTPNGAGAWHFAIITMMMMYGVEKDDAGIFALLVYGVQTFLLVLLGLYALVALPLTNKK